MYVRFFLYMAYDYDGALVSLYTRACSEPRYTVRSSIVTQDAKVQVRI